MKRAIVFAIAALLLTGCTTGTPAAIETTASASVPEPAVTAAEKPASHATPAADYSDLDMSDENMQLIAQGLFLTAVKDDIDVSMHTDEELMIAADAVCQGLDRGETLRALLITTAGLLPGLLSTEDVASFAGITNGTLCTLPDE